MLGFVHHSNTQVLTQGVQAVIGRQSGNMAEQDNITYNDSLSSSQAPLTLNLPRLKATEEWSGTWKHTAYNQITSIGPVFCQTNFMFIDWAGNSHPFSNITNCNADVGAPTLQDKTESSDGSFYRLDTTTKTDMQVVAKDGTTYHFSGNAVMCPGANLNGGECSTGYNYDPVNSIAGSIVDTNGNQLSIGHLSGTPSGSTSIYDDSGSNRPITFTASEIPTTSPTATISYSDSNGATQTISISTTTTGSQNYTPSLSCGPVSQPNAPNTLTIDVANTAENLPTTETVITFPAASSGSGVAQRAYSLKFDGLGELEEIQYPSGGSTSYAYNGAGGGSAGQTMGHVSCSYSVAAISTKTECTSADGSCSSPNVTTYTGVGANDLANNHYISQMTVTRPTSDKQILYYVPGGRTRSSEKESKVEFYDASGTLLKRIANTYPDPQSVSYPYDFVLPSNVTTTLYGSGTSVSSSTSYTYDTYNSAYWGAVPIDNPTGITQLDFGGATKTTTTEQYAAAGTFSTNNHILDRPTSKKVVEGLNSHYWNDSYTYDQGSNTYGNLTQVVKTATTAPTMTTTYTYDSHGRVLTVTDPLSHVTQISYTDSWANSTCAPSANGSIYPTSVTVANGTAVQEAVTYTYNSCTGTIASVSGPNTNQTTSYAYDALSRVVSQVLPDLGGKGVCYYDSAPNKVTTYTLRTSGTNLPTCPTAPAAKAGYVATSETLDGFGRKYESALLSDPQGIMYTDTFYDADGRASSQSNPYRVAADDLLTTYAYDALDRKITQTNPDQTTTQWSYGANTVTFTDESANQWKRTSDALGNLIQVLEPNGTSQTPGMETDYVYDGFNNLTSVNQCGGTCPSNAQVARTFSYDGLSRLVQAFNPESGWICYGTSGG
jgi:YD repeat-containing protein